MDFILGILVGGAAVWLLKTFLAPKVEAAIDEVKAKVVTVVHTPAADGSHVTTTTEEVK